MAEESRLPISPAPDFSDRVDALLSSALADQAREKRQLVDTLYGAKAALVKAEEEISALKEQMTERDAKLLEAIDKKFEARMAALEEAMLKLAKSMASIPQKVRSDLEVAAVAMGERMGEESDNLLRNVREDAVEVVATTGKLFDKNLAQIQNSIEAAREEYRTTTEQVVKYLGERDDVLQRQRDQVLIDLFRQLGESLGKRNAKKVSKAVAEDQNIGRRPQAQPARQYPPPPAYRRAPVSGPPAGQLGPGSSIVAPPERTRPPQLGGPQEPPRFQERDDLEGTELYEPVQPPQPMSNPLSKRESSREYLIPVSPYDGPSEDDEAAALDDMADRMFGPINPDEESKPRRARRKPEAPAPKMGKNPRPAKPPVKRAPRRKPPV